MRVLIVDDEADYRYLVRLSLGAEGHQVLEAEGCETACALAASHSPDVILVDVVLAGSSGLSLLPRLRQSSPGSAVVFHTVERERTAAMVGHPSGPDGLLEKGLGPKDLSQALEEIVILHRSRTGRATGNSR